jgi:hypothetical protein
VSSSKNGIGFVSCRFGSHAIMRGDGMIRLGANFGNYYIKYSMKKEQAVGPEFAVSFMLGSRIWFDIDDVAVGLSIRGG